MQDSFRQPELEHICKIRLNAKLRNSKNLECARGGKGEQRKSGDGVANILLGDGIAKILRRGRGRVAKHFFGSGKQFLHEIPDD